MVYFSNLYFIRSIVDPVAGITETAKRIAAGSYGVQIEKRYDDEIGALTDTINDMSLKINQSEKTVSYTHLDVYKRQAEDHQHNQGQDHGKNHHIHIADIQFQFVFQQSAKGFHSIPSPESFK